MGRSEDFKDNQILADLGFNPEHIYNIKYAFACKKFLENLVFATSEDVSDALEEGHFVLTNNGGHVKRVSLGGATDIFTEQGLVTLANHSTLQLHQNFHKRIFPIKEERKSMYVRTWDSKYFTRFAQIGDKDYGLPPMFEWVTFRTHREEYLDDEYVDMETGENWYADFSGSRGYYDMPGAYSGDLIVDPRKNTAKYAGDPKINDPNFKTFLRKHNIDPFFYEFANDGLNFEPGVQLTDEELWDIAQGNF